LSGQGNDRNLTTNSNLTSIVYSVRSLRCPTQLRSTS